MVSVVDELLVAELGSDGSWAELISVTCRLAFALHIKTSNPRLVDLEEAKRWFIIAGDEEGDEEGQRRSQGDLWRHWWGEDGTWSFG